MTNIENKKTGKDITEESVQTQERVIFEEFVDHLAENAGIESIMDRPAIKSRGALRKPKHR